MDCAEWKDGGVVEIAEVAKRGARWLGVDKLDKLERGTGDAAALEFVRCVVAVCFVGVETGAGTGFGDGASSGASDIAAGCCAKVGEVGFREPHSDAATTVMQSNNFT